MLFVKAAESEICGDGKLTTVGFRTSTHKIPQEFWTKGVDNSKIILETILDKIKFFEFRGGEPLVDRDVMKFITDISNTKYAKDIRIDMDPSALIVCGSGSSSIKSPN